MEPTQPPPVRRRRRWLIVTFVLVLVSLVSWWNWPRGDARFVGTWEIRVGSLQESEGMWTLRSDGLVKSTDQTLPGSLWFRWKVDGEELVLDDLESELVVDAVQKVADLVNSSTIVTSGDPELRYRILSVSSDRILLSVPQSADKVTLTRILTE